MLRGMAARVSRRLRRGFEIPLTDRRLSVAIDREANNILDQSSDLPVEQEFSKKTQTLAAMTLRILVRHIDRLMKVCPPLQTYHHPSATADLATALIFLEFCNNTVGAFSPQSQNVHLRRQLMTFKSQIATPQLRDHIDRQIALLDLEDGVVERATLLETDPHHAGLYAREATAFDTHYEAMPLFLAQARHEIDYSGDVRGHSILWFIKQNLPLYQNKRILHIGPETMVSAFFRDPANNMNSVYETSDGFSAIVDHLEDITDINLPSETYDVVICHRVLEHVLDDAAAIKEIRRVLKPCGVLDISVPQSMNRPRTVEWLAQDSSHHDHVRQYGRDFAGRLEEAGFTVTVDRSLLSRPSADHRADGTYPLRHYICTANG